MFFLLISAPLALIYKYFRQILMIFPILLLQPKDSLANSVTSTNAANSTNSIIFDTSANSVDSYYFW